jgi:hypothetical protein
MSEHFDDVIFRTVLRGLFLLLFSHFMLWIGSSITHFLETNALRGLLYQSHFLRIVFLWTADDISHPQRILLEVLKES